MNDANMNDVIVLKTFKTMPTVVLFGIIRNFDAWAHFTQPFAKNLKPIEFVLQQKV